MQKEKGIKNYFYILIILTILFITIKANEQVVEDVNAPEHTDKIKADEPGYFNKESFSEEWEKKMSDYEPDFVYMIPIEYKSSETFYQKFNKNPFKLRGAILVDEDKDEKLEFKIESPSGQILYFGVTGQLIFQYELKETGVYKFHFDNRYVNSELRVTFTLNSGNNDIIKKADLDFSHQKANELLTVISNMKNERKIRQGQIHNRSLSNFYLFLLTLFIFIIFIFMNLPLCRIKEI
jgi:hypothetical protein